jgi:hypothetical protein
MSDLSEQHSGSSEEFKRWISEQMEDLKKGQAKLLEATTETRKLAEESKNELHELKISISGNPDLGQKGLAERIVEAESNGYKNRTEIAKIKNDFKWWGILVSSLAFFVSLVVANWEKIFK